MEPYQIAFQREIATIRRKLAGLNRNLRTFTPEFRVRWSRAWTAATSPVVPRTREDAARRLAFALATLRVSAEFFAAGPRPDPCSPMRWCFDAFGTAEFDREGGNLTTCVEELEFQGSSLRARYNRECGRSRAARASGLAGLDQTTIEVTDVDRRTAEAKLSGTSRGLLTAGVVVAAVAIPLVLLIRRESRMGGLGSPKQMRGKAGEVRR